MDVSAAGLTRQSLTRDELADTDWIEVIIKVIFKYLTLSTFSSILTEVACKQRKPRLPFKKKIPFIHFLNNNIQDQFYYPVFRTSL